VTTRSVRTEAQRDMLVTYIKGRKLPLSVSVVSGKPRSGSQNNLQHKWYGEIAEQMGDQTKLEVENYCKLTFGVPILCDASDKYALMWETLSTNRSYEALLAAMPIIEVSRLFNVDQESKYLDAIHRHFSTQGFLLTQPM
jgi:hypothetical protein